MTATNSKTNRSLAFLNVRLDEVQLSQVERIKAKAQLARAEATVDAIFEIALGARQLLVALVVRPIRRMTASFG